MAATSDLGDYIAECREERLGLRADIINTETGTTFLGSTGDPFGGSSKEAYLADLRQSLADLDTIISAHEAKCP